MVARTTALMSKTAKSLDVTKIGKKVTLHLQRLLCRKEYRNPTLDSAKSRNHTLEKYVKSYVGVSCPKKTPSLLGKPYARLLRTKGRLFQPHMGHIFYIRSRIFSIQVHVDGCRSRKEAGAGCCVLRPIYFLCCMPVYRRWLLHILALVYFWDSGSSTHW